MCKIFNKQQLKQETILKVKLQITAFFSFVKEHEDDDIC